MTAGKDDPLAKRVRAARSYADMSRAGVAQAIGVDAQTIGRWERGEWKKEPPRRAMLEGVARVTGVPVEFMFSGFEGAFALADDALDALAEASRHAHRPTGPEDSTRT